MSMAKKKAGATAKSTSSTKIYFFKGKLHWNSLVTPDTRYNEAYTATIILDADSAAKFVASGIMTKPTMQTDKEGEELGVGYKFVRKLEDAINPGKPSIVDDKNFPLDPAELGRGSEVIAKVEVYPLTRYDGFGHRLLAIKCEKLVENTNRVDVEESAYAF